MSLNDLLATLQNLDRPDKWRVMQFLMSELAGEEGALLQPNTTYPVWSPYNSFEAAQTLLEALRKEDSHE
jgi:hypothetical protein